MDESGSWKIKKPADLSASRLKKSFVSLRYVVSSCWPWLDTLLECRQTGREQSGMDQEARVARLLVFA
jgi:hypothetical protein